MSSEDDMMAMELLRRGRPLAAPLPASDAEHYAWDGVYPLDPNVADTAALLRRTGLSNVLRSTSVYRVRHFEAARALVDADRSIGEEDLLVRADIIAISDDDLRAKLANLGLSIGELRQHYASNYPI